MQTTLKSSAFVGFLLVLLLAASAGCGTPKVKPKPWNLTITKSTRAQIKADIVGITNLEKPIWANYSIDNYWSNPNSLRRDADKLTALLQNEKPWVISVTDAKWQQWKARGVTELVLIADLPGRFEAGPGDPRRVFLSLDKNAWKSRDQLDIQIQENLIRVMTPQKIR
jgi:hypothetical protein